MEKIISIMRDPYEKGYNLFTKNKLTLVKGLNVLVGCNGSGKSTLLQAIKDYCYDNHHNIITYDNVTDGGKTRFMDLILNPGFGRGKDDSMMDEMAELSIGMEASEGETIRLHLTKFFRIVVNKWLQGNYDQKLDKNPLSKLFYTEEEIEQKRKQKTNEFYIICDAVDSGFSVNEIVIFKQTIDQILQTLTPEIELYVVVSANTFEMAKDTHCIDVRTLESMRFHTYDEYYSFIMKSAKEKNKRYDRWSKKKERDRLREIEEEKKKKEEEKEAEASNTSWKQKRNFHLKRDW